MIEPIVDVATRPEPPPAPWWNGTGGLGLVIVAGFFAIGSDWMVVRVIAVPFVALGAAIQGFVGGCETRRRK